MTSISIIIEPVWRDGLTSPFSISVPVLEEFQITLRLLRLVFGGIFDVNLTGAVPLNDVANLRRRTTLNRHACDKRSTYKFKGLALFQKPLEAVISTFLNH